MKSGSVIICEKPSQARNLRAALGGRFGRIMAARGHLYELAEPDAVRPEWKRWSGDLLHPGEPFPLAARPGTEELRRQLQKAIRAAGTVIIATDCDREGHLIGMEIVTQARFRGTLLRAVFSAEDVESIRAAFGNLRPAGEFDGLWKAGMARQQADQIVNLTLTRTVTTHMLGPGKGALGIGRVRTPTLAIICRREAEIRDFVPEDRLVAVAEMTTGGAEWRAECRLLPGTGQPILASDAAAAIARAVKGWRGTVKVETVRKTAAPPMPHDLSSLQQVMGGRKWPAAKTLEIAQDLYAELKLITYPRAEARVWPEAMAGDVEAIRGALAAAGITGGRHPGDAVIRRGKGRGCCFSDHRLAGASHHAIAPNAATIADWAELWSAAGADQKALMQAVSNRYLACTDADHVYDQTAASFTVRTGRGNAGFAASGRATIRPGWTIWEAAGSADAEGRQSLPAGLSDGNAASECTDSRIDARPTKPPGRYTEGGIIAAMRDAWKFLPKGDVRDRLRDASGVGTPATRDRVVETLVRQGQIKRAKGRFRPTALGMELWQRLESLAPGVTDPGLTAIWEQMFDGIERGGGDRWWETVEAIVAEADRNRQAILGDGAASGSLDSLVENRTYGKSGARGRGAARKPTGKQLDYARVLAERAGIDLPAGCLADAAACSRFIDLHKAEGNR